MEPGDSVRIHNGTHWTRTGKVIDCTQEPRLYLLRTDKNTVIRRNRRQLLKTAETFNHLSDSSTTGSLIENDTPNESSVDSDATIPYDKPLTPTAPTTRFGRKIKQLKHLKDFQPW